MRPDESFLPVNDPKKYIGKQVHLSWAHRGCVWHLENVVGETAYLITPKTKRRITAHVRDLRHTKTRSAKLQSQ